MPIKETTSKFWSFIAYIFSGLSAFFGAMTLERFALIVGIVTAILTFIINWHYKRQHRRMAEAAIRAGRIDCATCERVQGE